MTGRLFLVVGPSGVGKDTLLAGAKAADAALHWARRVITRPATDGGEPFEGVTADAFQQRLTAGEFALHWQAHGLSYGVPAPELAPLTKGATVLVNGSRGAVAAALAAFPALIVVRISAPSGVLADRLVARGRESREDIIARLGRASYTLPESTRVIDIQNTGTPSQGVAQLLQALRA
jgi:ribose 1,5-bisphosphokinase